MRTRSRLAALAAGCALVAGAALTGGCGSSDGDAAAGSALLGAGATFPASAYQRWARDEGGVTYQPKGSGAGIEDLIDGLVQFAGSDAPLTPRETARLAASRGGAEPVYFPALLGAVAVPVHLSRAPGRIQLTGEAIGDIFAGDVTRWDDPAIAASNPGVELPGTPITACVRADASGTSFNFSRFLAGQSATFKATVGRGPTPAWGAPLLIRQPGNPGVAQCVRTNDGSIGYVDLGDARRAGLDQLAAVGVDGRFTAPSVETITEAGAHTTPVPELIIDPGAEVPAAGYPITITTWIVTYSDHAAAGSRKLEDVRAWLEYVYSPAAQDTLAALGFAPLPEDVVVKGAARIATLT